MGRLTRNPETKFSQDGTKSVTRYTLAVDRRFKREGEPSADFINCVAFGKQAEFAGKYLQQGTKVVVVGRIQTGSYTNREGQKVYTTDIIVEEQEFAESKKAETTREPVPEKTADDIPASAKYSDGFMQIPDGIEDEMPF